jgi:methylated-DNA-[protein]-cysteine S-methyltransferase
MLMRGDDADLSAVPLDFGTVTPFRQDVDRAARLIPPGSTSTYGELAHRIGNPSAARAVGQAMRNNPFPIVVPCHRVVAAGGRIGGFSADGGVSTKAKMLAIEGALLPALPFDAAAAVDHLHKADTILSGLIDEVGPLSLPLTGATSVFGALAEAIVYQQLTGKAAATIFARVQALFSDGGAELVPETVLGATDEELRGAGLSRAKTASLRDLALKTVEGDLPTLAETSTCSTCWPQPAQVGLWHDPQVLRRHMLEPPDHS